MRRHRASGLLLHPTSLPGRFGIGDHGPEAQQLADFLAGAGQAVWQVLPLGPTGFGDSPYQCFSAFAGNPLLVSPELLVEEGFLDAADLDQAPRCSEHEVDYGAVIGFKQPLLARAAKNFEARASQAQRDDFAAFCARHAGWLDDFALFMAVKHAHAGKIWTEWDPAVAAREPEALALWRGRFLYSWFRGR